jgi:hypothetical protein
MMRVTGLGASAASGKRARVSGRNTTVTTPGTSAFQRIMSACRRLAHLQNAAAVFPAIADGDDDRIPSLARICLTGLAGQLLSPEREISAADPRSDGWAAGF